MQRANYDLRFYPGMPELPLFVVLLIVVALCALIGAVNGSVIAFLKVPPFIATLGVMNIIRSVAQYFTKSYTPTVPKSFEGIANTMILGQRPMTIVYWLVLAVIFYLVMKNTAFGRHVYAVGSNARAAHLAGINVSAMRTLVFIIAGALVGLGAFLWIAMNASADPATTGKSYEMYAIAAVVLGGIAMSGGKGRILGVLFGAMSYTVIDKIIIALKMDSLINDTIKGVILIVVILIQVAGPQLKARFGKSKVVK